MVCTHKARRRMWWGQLCAQAVAHSPGAIAPVAVLHPTSFRLELKAGSSACAAADVVTVPAGDHARLSAGTLAVPACQAPLVLHWAPAAAASRIVRYSQQ